MDTSRNNDLNIIRYKGFPSIYDQIDEAGWETRNDGYSYEDDLFENNTSGYLQKNPNMRQIFPFFNRMVSHLINSVKYLRNFNNYGVRKDYKRIN